ncbi:MAG: hypothetical protein HDS91_06050 [Bacteroidales bacterium]|nr:hypothetical protein [Bacteroidales bacterium]
MSMGMYIVTQGQEHNPLFDTAQSRFAETVFNVCFNRSCNINDPKDLNILEAILDSAAASMRMGFSDDDILRMAFQTGPRLERMYHKNTMIAILGMLCKWFPSDDINNFRRGIEKYYIK